MHVKVYRYIDTHTCVHVHSRSMTDMAGRLRHVCMFLDLIAVAITPEIVIYKLNKHNIKKSWLLAYVCGRRPELEDGEGT